MPLEFLKQNVLLLALVVISGTMLVWPLLRRTGAKDVSAADATLMINRENALVVDVRSPAEFAAGHIPEAINIPADKLGERAGELEKHKGRPLIISCQSGMRSGSACGELKKLGYSQLFNLAGGLGEWQKAGMPLRKGNK